MTIADVLYLIANGMVVVAYLLIANVWFRLRELTWLSPQPPTLRILLAWMISLDATTFLLDAGTRFVPDIFARVNALAHIALAVVASITAYTIVKRARMLRARAQ